MAPVDRREHRQQRVRGAGQSSVQASFGFDFGALAARPAKQASLPPQRSSRRTPVHRTPRGSNGSVQRHRSASVQRSTGARRRTTPRERTVTPHLGKRKRGSKDAQASGDEEERDELSPDHQGRDRSVEKSRKVIGTATPLREDFDDVPDELSILEESAGSARKLIGDVPLTGNGTPASTVSKKRVSSIGPATKTPIGHTNGSRPSTRKGIMRRSKSTDPGPVTPSMLPANRARPTLASRSVQSTATPSVIEVEENLSDDELSPPKENDGTPRVVQRAQSENTSPNDEDADADELSSEPQSTPAQPTPQSSGPKTMEQRQNPASIQAEAPVSIIKSLKYQRARRVIDDKEVESEDEVTATIIQSTPAPVMARTGTKRNLVETSKSPATDQRRKKTGGIGDPGRRVDAEADELSPETNRNKRPTIKPGVEGGEAFSEASLYETEESEPEALPTAPARRKTISPRRSHPPKTSDKPPRKRQKFSGPKQVISVMRIKGSAIKGITLADTTRTIIEQSIDHRLARMIEKMQTSQDSACRKELRAAINLSLSFKESLNEKLLDLQDANDVLSANLKKMKLSKRENATLRKDILAVQNSRQEVALEHDDVQAGFDARKEKVEARNTLSANMFDIEAAIRSGRERARKQGREEEGPEIPLSMLLDTVGRDVGSSGGGLLMGIQKFNVALERAAGWLEGRA